MARLLLLLMCAAALLGAIDAAMAEDEPAAKAEPFPPASGPAQSFPPGRMPGIYLTPPIKTKEQLEAEERRKNQSGGCKFFPGKLDLIV